MKFLQMFFGISDNVCVIVVIVEGEWLMPGIGHQVQMSTLTSRT